ncbi:sirohydrochlorin chelatase [Actinoplanes friuliensis]|uniref:Cobalamin (Vitamin B12) biosynthesis CbiX protein n=1 Tax=Actinoplanes friuliensis DSM 7358 TaxID=1246995 RepID=U5WA19_9ACTN|nr:CbiX/SirB N-terminal domain-containing protein [Actinoplanes friuliensis]AGZ45867.1 cobalamin (vitamin B12) biosynthesis CbiX protein [Actinoplanes friuliensis DSM 7358]
MRPARLAVVLVAHGSRDPRAAQATEALARAVGEAYPLWDVRASYLDHSVPRPRQVLADFEARGHRRAIMLPLLLTAAYHGRVDVPGEITAARADGLTLDVTLADVLGPLNGTVPTDLLNALQSRLAEATDGDEADRLDAVVLTAAGTRDAGARATVDQAAAALGARLGIPCRVAYASAAPPLSGEAVAELHAEGHHRVGLASYFLAPGLLYDNTVRSAREAGVVAVAEPMTDTPDLVALVASRVNAAATARPAAAYAA